mmetsp:Transcript_73786/g.130330  ORF Transcript_73786/g.130330 Transcript_73786/m.130330 type:complete len:522 (-) Transcript_73786:62-1627(-)
MQSTSSWSRQNLHSVLPGLSLNAMLPCCEASCLRSPDTSPRRSQASSVEIIGRFDPTDLASAARLLGCHPFCGGFNAADVNDKIVCHEILKAAESEASASPEQTKSLDDEEYAQEAGPGEWWLGQEPGLAFTSLDEKVQLVRGWWGRPPEIGSATPRTPRWAKGLRGWLRRKVADRRHRYDFNGFDLDLAYVTSRIIAMGFPSRGVGSSFRNPQSEVSTFLRLSHGNDFRIYNLCSEKSYRENGFPDETVSYPSADHCPPSFQDMLHFCQDVESWLKRKESNVAVVHCKAGKGRSGTMVCAFLVYAGALRSTAEALMWFAGVRGGTRSGVTIASQIRWVVMFEHWLQGKVQLLSDPMASLTSRYRLQTVRVGPLRSRLVTAEGAVLIRVGLASRSKAGVKFVHFYKWASAMCNEDDVAVLELPKSGPVWSEHEGMACLELASPDSCCIATRSKKQKRLQFKSWWHHSFLQQKLDEDTGYQRLVLELPKVFVDGLRHDALINDLVPPTFQLTLEFQEVSHTE